MQSFWKYEIGALVNEMNISMVVKQRSNENYKLLIWRIANEY